jgi:predicted O-linked N-acetylglucosamine transferase (SPINDLY family)
MAKLLARPLKSSAAAVGSDIPADDVAASLDRLIGTLRAGATPPLADEAGQRLRNVPFDAILNAVERARFDLAGPAQIALYKLWIEDNPASNLAWAAWFNIGTVCSNVGDKANATIAYGNAKLLRPDIACTSINLGLLQEAAGNTEQALATWLSAVQPDAERVQLQIQQGRLLEKLGRLDEAEKILRRVLLTDPAQPDVVHHWVHLRQKTCQWPATPRDIPGLPESGLLASSGPLGILALTDDISLQNTAAAGWVARKTSLAPRRLAPATPYGHARIRIGYMSSDFCSHAMSYLITELFERHDRSRFEIFGYCASQEDGTALRQRVIGAFDHHRIIRELTDGQAAQLIRDDEIDVLIDLNGITDGSRLAVLRWRPAPIQASYLGFIGPLPLPELDYILCDDVVIPPEHRLAYGGKALSIGPLYQVNDSKRTIGGAITRAEAGLPENAFVLCSFTKHFKITEQMFAAWMTILHAAPRAVLWLAGDNEYSRTNLIEAASRAGITPERLIFSDRADPDLYMSRLGVADLFLDTFPYNAGTVASDAMRMGLPLVTLCGKSFASRMATSLLHAIGAPAGITTSLQDYVETATRLATDPAAHASYKSQFTPRAWNGSLGNIENFTTAFEDTWIRLTGGLRRDGQAAIPSATVPVFKLNQILNEAISHHQSGRLDIAESLYANVLALPDAPVVTHFNLGLLLTVQGRMEEAGEAFRRALAIQPDYADALVSLGTVRLAQGQCRDAEDCYRRAIAIDAGNAMAHGNLGKALHDMGRTVEAFAAYRASLTLRPDNPDVLMNFGAALMDSLAWEDAVTVTRQAVTHKPGSAMAHANLATALLSLGRYDEALEAASRAMALPRLGAAIEGSLGGVMLELGALGDAITLSRNAVALDPSRPDAHFNLSHALKGMNDLPEAEAAARQAIALRPDCAVYHFHLAHILLLRGELEAGWEEYEWRWKLPEFAWADTIRGNPDRPQWAGEDIAGKTLLIYTEQGLGDIVQFARFLPLAAARAGRVIVAARPLMRRLLASIEGIDIVPLGAALPPYDVHCPLMSLPRAFATRLDSIPAALPYLRAELAEVVRWQQKTASARLRVGLVWAGNPATMRDRFRSPGLASIESLFALPGVDFVVLQMGPGRAGLEAHELPKNVRDLGPEIGDLTDTAAIMSGLDLVISSCTGPLHLAGALGVPVWAILPFAPHFPWLLEREDTLWYPSMRLYRQEKPGLDWAPVVARIAGDLSDLGAMRDLSNKNTEN